MFHNIFPLIVEDIAIDIISCIFDKIKYVILYHKTCDFSAKESVCFCTGISSQMNIPTPYALKVSFQIFGWGMRTHIQNAKHFEWVFARSASSNKNTTQFRVVFLFGDPYGNRTHVFSVRGWCLNRLTNEPWHIRSIIIHFFAVFVKWFSKSFFKKINFSWNTHIFKVFSLFLYIFYRNLLIFARGRDKIKLE